MKLRLMNKLAIIAGIIMMSICGVSCSDDKDLGTDFDKSQIVDYPLPDRFSIKASPDKAIIIDSSFQFKQVFGEKSEELNKVDFNRYNLIYIQGVSPQDVVEITPLWNTDKTPARLSLDVQYGLLTVLDTWSRAYLVPKGLKKINIKVNYTPYPVL